MSLIFSAVAIYFFHRYKILDVPNHRSNHFSATLTGGGIAIVLSLTTITLLSYFSAPDNFFLYFILAICLLASISFIDDIKNLPIPIRVCIQIISIGILLYSSLEGLNYTLYLLFGAIILVFLNLYNFMDGIDGSNSAEAVHIASGIAILSMFNENIPLEIAGIACIIAGSCLAFLKFNWHPARIFLGDVGSTTLGLILGWMLVVLFLEGMYAASIILPMYYLADSGITILKRLYAGKKIWQAHSEHFYQIAVRNGTAHNIVVTKIISCNLLLLLLSIFSIIYPISSIIISIIITLFLLYNLQKPHMKNQ